MLNDVHMMLLLIITSFTIFSIANIYVTVLKYLRKSCFIFFNLLKLFVSNTFQLQFVKAPNHLNVII